MLKYVYVALATILFIIPVINTQYEHKEREFPGTLQLSGVEYGEYPEYGSKLHHTNRDLGWGIPSQRNLPLAVPPAVNTISHNEKKVDDVDDTLKLKVVPNWPDSSKQLGQLSAVSVDGSGNIVIFHRGDRIWGAQTFRYDNVYNERNKGPILQNTVVVFNATTGLVVEEWGRNMFYLPHGLTVDHENNVWVTDVALHQVFKFSGSASHQPLLTLGAPFIPGNDERHFCKPTDVAISTSGDFFVSDGYCNSRIVKFDKTGVQLMVWGRSSFNGFLGSVAPPNHFLVPHALALAEEREILFVADRENGRIQCFNSTSGIFITQLMSQLMGSRIFSVAYAPAQGGLLYVVNGPEIQAQGARVGGFVISLASRQLIGQFNTNGKGLQNPHDVAVSSDGSQVYVVELNPYKVWKFVSGNLNQSSLGHAMNEDTHSNSKTNTTGSVQNFPLKIDTTKYAAKIVDESNAVPKNGGSVATAVGVIVGVIAVIIVIISLVVVHIRRGYNKSKRWEFPVSSSEGFKLGQFLDRHQGFEKVSTEESDDEGSGSSTSELTVSRAQFA
ncbi:peptidyl-alpha-hydroxyglycine alpha-amidating lyase 1 isoform X2 [Anabrus simplex]|uniref:peptidyl-alpha-hydroxyglycine alpha-amidating lyase 1 isoform X2 n=1 Tax=Anabrus simplex TaxID=316456 RepID=UPI0034DDB9EF